MDGEWSHDAQGRAETSAWRSVCGEPQVDEGHPGGTISYLMDWTAYIAVVVGYVVGILTNGPVKPLGLLAVTGGNVLWLLLYIRTIRGVRDEGEVRLLLCGMIGLALLVVAADLLGGGFDWMLPVLTVAIVASIFPVRLAFGVSMGLWLYTAAILYMINGPSDLARLDGNRIQGPLSLLPAFVFAFIFVFVVQRHQMERQRAEALVARIEEAQRELRAHAAEAEELAIARERNRMAREIHDTLGHYLTILAVQLETALKLEERADGRLRGELMEARRVTAECLAEVRRSVAALRPADLAATSLPEALRRLVAEAGALLPGTEIALDIEGPTPELAPELRVALYRCAQEALTNVRKHAAASNTLVRLRVDANEARASGAGRWVELLVLDNGRGARSNMEDGGLGGGATPPPGFGLLGMGERIALLGGEVRSGPEPGKGWRVETRIPLLAAPTEAHSPAAAPLGAEG